MPTPLCFNLSCQAFINCDPCRRSSTTLSLVPASSQGKTLDIITNPNPLRFFDWLCLLSLNIILCLTLLGFFGGFRFSDDRKVWTHLEARWQIRCWDLDGFRNLKQPVFNWTMQLNYKHSPRITFYPSPTSPHPIRTTSLSSFPSLSSSQGQDTESNVAYGIRFYLSQTLSRKDAMP
jgi:hypothetical protein